MELLQVREGLYPLVKWMFYREPQTRRIDMKTLYRALAVLCVLTSTDATAKTSSPVKAERVARHAECVKRAQLKRFERRFAARSRFLKECMSN
jgi:hypothetical protein